MYKRESFGIVVIIILLVILAWAATACQEPEDECNWRAYNSVMDMYRSQFNYQEQLGIAYQMPGKTKTYYDSVAKISLRISEHQGILYDSMKYFLACGCPKSDRHYIAPEGKE
jgi:hypothetical protein